MIKPRRYKVARKHERKLWRKIKSQAEQGKIHQARATVRLYLRSRDCKLVAVHKANLRCSTCKWLTPEEERKLAEALNPWKGTKEKAYASKRPKSNGGYRVVIEFGLEARALQLLIKEALTAFRDVLVRPNQYILRGGRDKASEKVIEHLENGFDHVQHIDLKNCFSSFDEEKVPELLPLAKKVTERSIISRHLSLGVRSSSPGLSTANLLAEARRGIPQGSSASSVVAEILLAEIASKTTPSSEVIIYGDNILALSHNFPEAVSTAKSLRLAMQCHPAGPLCSKSEELHIEDGSFVYVGYDFSAGPKYRDFDYADNWDEIWSVYPSQKNMKKLEKNMKRLTTDPQINAAKVAEFLDWLGSWKNSFRLSEFVQFEAELIGDRLTEDFGPSFQVGTSIVEPVVLPEDGEESEPAVVSTAIDPEEPASDDASDAAHVAS